MKKVVVGISGGVDSSVAAILLKEKGYDVVGLFMRNWDSSINNDFLGNPNLNNNICPQEEDYNDAKAVCDKLGIPLHRVDFIKEYWDDVFTYFLDELKKGRTPNPDIMCNKYIKFDCFIDFAKKHQVDYIATGHYAKVVHENGHSKLYKAKDKNKDQSYFLSFLSISISCCNAESNACSTSTPGKKSLTYFTEIGSRKTILSAPEITSFLSLFLDVQLKGPIDGA